MVTSSGLHSTVTSAPATVATDSSTDTSRSAGMRDGVPPPTNTEVAAGMPSRSVARRTSVTHAAAYASIRWSRSV